MDNPLQKLILTGAAAVSAAGIIGGSLAFAQSSPQTQVDSFVTSLAGNLGVSEDSLESALQQTSMDLIDEAEATGEITAERAAQLRAQVEAGENLVMPSAGMRGGHRGAGHVDSEALAGFLGITSDELRTELQSGATLAEIAEGRGQSREELKAFLTSEQEADLAEKVTAGTLTQAEADEKLAGFTANLDSIVDSTRPAPAGGPGGHGGHGGRGGIGADSEAIAGFLGITAAELRAELQAGATLAEVAEAQGQTRESLGAFLTSEFETKLAERVAAGMLTQEEADEKLAEFEANLDARLDSTGPVGGGPRGGRGHFGVVPAPSDMN